MKRTQGNWTVKETESEEYSNHFDYSIHAPEQELHTIPTDETSPLWKFTPYIADIKFGRSNEERQTNADYICTAVNNHEELLQMVKDLKNCIGRLTEQEQPDKALEAYWIGEAHELLLKVNGGKAYLKNANETTNA